MTQVEIESQLFEWDADKAARNYAIHKVEFEAAAAVFFDEHALFEPNAGGEGEARFHVIGSLEGLVILFIAYTERSQNGKESIRIISARAASKKERRRYFGAR